MKVSIFNGAGQADYLYGLVSGLVKTPINTIHVLDIDKTTDLFSTYDKVTFHTVYRYQPKGSSLWKKARNLLRFYYLQARHLLFSKAGVVHFQWLDRYFFADRVLLPLVALLGGHKAVLTVHNVNAGKRDNRDNWFNRFTLHSAYRLCHHLIVHTPRSKSELINDFNIPPQKISIIKHGMNNKVMQKGISTSQARENLSIPLEKKVVLFFGNIDYYKGLDLLLKSIEFTDPELRRDLIVLIAGNYKSVPYIRQVFDYLDQSPYREQIINHIRFIPDDQIESYFMAADCIVLPYRDIYQSGVLFMAYNFGLPVLATKVGNFENDILTDKTGFLIDEISPESIASGINKYFSSDLYYNLDSGRNFIKNWSNSVFSWSAIGMETHDLYLKLFTQRYEQEYIPQKR